jgi:hypothetical protein
MTMLDLMQSVAILILGVIVLERIANGRKW